MSWMGLGRTSAPEGYIYIILLGMYSGGDVHYYFFCFVPGKNRVYRDMRRYFVGIFTNGMIMERDVT